MTCLHCPMRREHGMKYRGIGAHACEALFDLIAWHIGVLDAKWYVKSRSTVGLRSTSSISTHLTCSTIFCE